MRKFLKEVFTYFWIPLIIALVSYILFQLRDVLLGLATLLVLSAVYTTIQLYLQHKKWWLGLIMIGLALGYLLFFFFRAPTTSLSINNQLVKSDSVSFISGSVHINPSPQTNGEYVKNSVVTLTANPAPGYDWKGWTGTENDGVNPTTITMTGSKRVSAVFEKRFSLIINNQQVIGSLVSLNEGSVFINPAPGGDGKYTNGTVVTLSARANSGYDWKSWQGTGSDGLNPASMTINSDKQITVYFDPRFSLTIGNQLVIGSSVSFNEGSVIVNPAPAGDSKYTSGTEVTLTAVPNAGYDWRAWQGTVNDTSNSTHVTITSDKHVGVSFDRRYSLTINGQAATGPSVGTTGGSVSLDPGPGKDNLFTRDAAVNITATPAAGYRFDRWTGDVSGNAATVNIVMNANKSVTANFVRIYTLTTATLPAAGGSVTPGSGVYDEGAIVNLTATAASGYRFDHWSGDASGNAPTASVTMNANKSVTAHFVRVYTLTTSIVPAQGGTVAPSAGTYDEGASVSLTATPAAGYRFDRWTGDAAGNTATISITMNANKSVTANFVRIYTLTTAALPAAGGSVTPGSGVYDEGAIVNLTATAAAGYRFDHWSGDASGNAPTVSVTMNANKSVIANFVPDTPPPTSTSTGVIISTIENAVSNLTITGANIANDKKQTTGKPAEWVQRQMTRRL
jgi:uncharacterized repeat protein (TIGR02543 family)